MSEDDWVLPVHMQAKEQDRQIISDQVEAFLRAGGKIKQCGPEDNAQADFSPRRTREQMRKDLKQASYREMERRRAYFEEQEDDL